MWRGGWDGWGFRGLGWLGFMRLDGGEGTAFGRTWDEMNVDYVNPLSQCNGEMIHILSKEW